MQIGVGLDARLGLSFEQHREMAGEAARLGYQSLWSPAGAAGLDSFHVCAAWNQASASLWSASGSARTPRCGGARRSVPRCGCIKRAPA